MSDKQKDIRHAQIWDLLYTYADIRDSLEDALLSFRELYAEIEYAMSDITDELEALQGRPDECSGKLRRFKNPGKNQYEVVNEQCELPFED